MEFYTEFVKFIFGKEHLGGCVPLLKYVIGKFYFLINKYFAVVVPQLPH